MGFERPADGDPPCDPPCDGSVEPETVCNFSQPLAESTGGSTASDGLPEPPGYRILEELPGGGMGRVCRAERLQDGRVVALKFLRAGRMACEDEKERLRREAQAVRRLNHPGIVEVLEQGEFQGAPYFAMEFVPGPNLAQRLEAGPLAPPAAAEIALQICEPLHYAHQRGVIHRDLKPSNILLGMTGQPRLTDFGIARCEQLGGSLTSTGSILGTPGYMPPEQAGGQLDLMGPASDVYGVGCLLFELLTGRPPFVGASPVDVLLQVVSEAVPTPSELNPAVPEPLDAICIKCLRKEVFDRYLTARALGDDLNRFLQGRPVHAARIGDSPHAVSQVRERRELERLQSVRGARVPRPPGWDLSHLCRPASTVSGDYYDIATLPGDRLLFAQADVSARGLAASLIVAQLQGLIRGQATHMAERLEDWLQELNQLLAEGVPEATYVSLLLGTIDCASGRARWVNAGHPPPLLVSPAGTVRACPEATTVLGVVPTVSPVLVEKKLAWGERLVAYANGIVDGRNRQGEPFGIDRLVAVVRQHAASSSAVLVTGVLDALTDFMDGADVEDDATITVLRREPSIS